MARTNPMDTVKHHAMLHRRLKARDNPFPEGRWPSLDDIVFLPANLSRLVIDPYREACRIDVKLGAELDLSMPFLVCGFDAAPEEVRRATAVALKQSGIVYLGEKALDSAAPWIQWRKTEEPDERSVGYIQEWCEDLAGSIPRDVRSDQIRGLSVNCPDQIDPAICYGLQHGLDVLVLDGAQQLGHPEGELKNQPQFDLLPLAVEALRRCRQEETIALVYVGGVRSGTDAAKLIGMGASIVGYGVAAALAMGGMISENSITYDSDRTIKERAAGLQALLQANAGEASMMARCTGKTRLHNLEPEDLRTVTLAAATTTRIPLVGHQTIDTSQGGLFA